VAKKEQQTQLSEEAVKVLEKLPETWQEIAQQFEVVDVREVLPGFSLEPDKEKLIGRPFAIVEWIFRDSDKVMRKGVPAQYVSVSLIVKDMNERLVINDGGTGIYAQLMEITRKLGPGGKAKKALYVPKGLRKSEYIFDNGEQSGEAVTYYLAI
jgi:hypothetical protein